MTMKNVLARAWNTCTASQPPAATTASRATLPASGQNMRPAPCEAKKRGQAESEQAVAGADDLQVPASELEHRGVAVEPIHPQRRRNSRHPAHGAGDRGDHRAAGPGRSKRALRLAGTHVGGNQSGQRGAEADRARDHDVFEPRRGALAGQRCRAIAAYQCGGGDDRTVAEHSA